jgi:outer membrane biosynthesis protein TonB
VRAVLNPPQPIPCLRRAGNCAPYLVILLLLAWLNAGAQLAPADDFFNSGAQLYISNNIPSALEQVENGLKTYPNDVKLKKLEELLKQQQQSQSQQNQQQQNQQNQQSQANQQQQKNQQSKQQQQSQSQQNQQQQNQQQSQQNKEQQNQSAQQKQQQSQPSQKGNEEQQASATQGKEMSPEEAKRLLDAQKGDEQVLQWKPQGKPEDQNRPIKDW